MNNEKEHLSNLRQAKKNFKEETFFKEAPCAISIGVKNIDSGPLSVGLKLYFGTKEQLEAFPYKEELYQGVYLYKIVVGKIAAQRLKSKEGCKK